ncbi:MAG: LUD domain-containing protein [Paludibacteraceae bacterium]
MESISGKCYVFDDEKTLFAYLKNILVEKNIDFLFCKEKNIIEKLDKYHIPHSTTEKIESMQAAVTNCECLIARTGSVVITSASESGRQLASYTPIHIMLADTSQLVDYPTDAYEKIVAKYAGNFPSQVTTITGPSRTADIEKTLVLGAHGPKEFIVLLCKEKTFNNFVI